MFSCFQKKKNQKTINTQLGQKELNINEPNTVESTPIHIKSPDNDFHSIEKVCSIIATNPYDFFLSQSHRYLGIYKKGEYLAYIRYANSQNIEMNKMTASKFEKQLQNKKQNTFQKLVKELDESVQKEDWVIDSNEQKYDAIVKYKQGNKQIGLYSNQLKQIISNMLEDENNPNCNFTKEEYQKQLDDISEKYKILKRELQTLQILKYSK